MFRSMLFVFIAGWVAWFWIDKPDPRAHPLPPVSDSVVQNFQRAFDMLKGGFPDLAYLYIWNAHYLLLTLLGGLLLLAVFQGVSRSLGRRRMRRQYLPPRRGAAAETEKQTQPQNRETPE